MVLNLEPFQAPLPYPEIRKVKLDPALIPLLMEGYSGATSEMTTVLQYAYHSLCCNKYRELADTLRGIFYVETLHMEFLGECICRLGGNPLYTVTLQEKAAPWQSALIDYEDSPAKMLLADIEGEKQAAAYYAQTALQMTQPELAALMSRLAEDEMLHVRMFTDLYNRIFRGAGRCTHQR